MTLNILSKILKSKLLRILSILKLYVFVVPWGMELKDLPDSDLVLYIINHDDGAFSEVISRYEDSILKYGTLLLGNELAGREISEESFIYTYKYINAINQRLTLKLMLFRSLNKLAHNYLEKHKTQNVSEGETLIDELFNVDNTESEFSEPKFMKLLKSNLQKLPFKYKDVSILHFYLKEDTEAISDILMLPLGVVLGRISEARAKILTYEKK